MTTDSTGQNDPFDLKRFVTAQERSYITAIAELRSGQKRSHWMWYIFPQIDGLGHSPTARFYAIRSRDEACAYLHHPVLGPRLLECSEALLSLEGSTASAIFGFPDDLKLRSSMTLFACVANPPSVFDLVIKRYFNGERDTMTTRILGGPAET